MEYKLLAPQEVECPVCGKEKVYTFRWDTDKQRSSCAAFLCLDCGTQFAARVVAEMKVTYKTETQVLFEQTGEAPSIDGYGPNWDCAPKWAEWCAMDGDGSANWYEYTPTPAVDGDYWKNPSGGKYKATDTYKFDGEWYQSLERRPREYAEVVA